MADNLQNLIRILGELADMAFNEGWFTLEYLTAETLHMFLSDSARADAELLREIPLLIQGIEQLLSTFEAAGIFNYLQESITGDETPEEKLAAEFLRCVAERKNGAQTLVRLKKIISIV